MKKRLLAIGEALIDFIPSSSGCDFDEIEYFTPAVGGAPANVCAAFSAAGGESAFLGMLGDDLFGRKTERFLRKHGVETKFMRFTDKANTALAFVTLDSSGQRDFSFYRSPSADMLYSESDVDESAFENAFALHFCSVCLCDFPVRGAHIKAIELARKHSALISFDPNLRFPLWKDKDELFNTVWKFIPEANILKISDEELPFLYRLSETDAKDAKTHVRSVIDRICSLAEEGRLFSKENYITLLSCGAAGAYAFVRCGAAYLSGEKNSIYRAMSYKTEPDREDPATLPERQEMTGAEGCEAEYGEERFGISRRERDFLLSHGIIPFFSPASNAGVAVDTTGAGDAFAGAFLRSLENDGVCLELLSELAEEEPEPGKIQETAEAIKRALDFAVRFSGKSVTSKGAIDSYPHMSPAGGTTQVK